MALLRSILILAVAVVLASCRTLTAPPGFASAGSGTAGRIEFPEGVSLEAQYSLLAWYVEEHGAVANRQAAEAYGVALNARNERGALLRGNGARSLVQRYPGFAYIPRQGGIAFRCETLGSRTDFAELDGMLAVCQETLLFPRSVEVPVGECVAFLSSYADAKEVSLFQAWASRNGVLELGGEDSGALKTVRLCRESLALKDAVCLCVSSVQELIQSGGHDSEALDILDEMAKKVGATKDFGVIGDYKTLRDFREMSVEAPLACVNRVLGQYLVESELVDAFEAPLSLALAVWEKDPRFHEVLVREDGRIREVVAKAFAARMGMIERLPQSCGESGAYWPEISWAKERILELQSEDGGNWGCYVRYGYVENLISALKAVLERLCGPAVEYYLRAQGEMVEREDRQAVVVALHGLLKELDADGEALAISGKRNGDALSRLSRRGAFCPLFWEEFSSVVDQVSGRVWSEDLRQVLRDELDRSNAGLLCGIVGDSSFEGALRFSGEILEFTGGEEVVRTETRTHRWYSDPRLEDSSQGVVFVQDLFEETILVHVYSRTGVARVKTRIFQADTEKSFEEVLHVDQSKEFVQEEMVSTEKLRSVRCDDERQTMAPGSAAVLRNDRRWSSGEMLDSCRQEMLKVWVEWILRNAFPAKCYAVFTGDDDQLDVAEVLGEGLFAWAQCQFPVDGALWRAREAALAELPREIRHSVTKGLTQFPEKKK